MFVGMERRYGFQHPGVCAYCVPGIVDTLVDLILVLPLKKIID